MKFYDGKLFSVQHSSAWETGKIIQIWKDALCPIVFCHVEGLEKSQTVSTDEGNEQSKSNDAERDHAVRLLGSSLGSVYFLH